MTATVLPVSAKPVAGISITAIKEGRWPLNDEIVFKLLGFEHLDSMDYSEYEGANIIHDLNNTDIPKDLENKYDFILDAGTIEHVFDFKNVLKNIFKMLKPGGTFFFEQPTFFGFNHGYYNFSPSLFYEYFKANNYEINMLVPYANKGEYIYIADPVINDIYGKMPMVGENSDHIIWGSVTKTEKTTFDVIPIQGGYVKEWENPNSVIKDTFEQAGDSSLFLYGTGLYAQNMIASLPDKYKKRIAGLLSNAESEKGKICYGCHVYMLEDVLDRCSTILIVVSNQYQGIVYDRICHLESKGIKVVRLCK